MRSRTLVTVAAASILAYGLALAIFAPRGFPPHLDHGGRMPFLSHKPLGEDAFYMIAIGWNLGTGRGFTYGGTATTGSQPLMTLAYGAIAAGVRRLGGDRWTMARAALACNVVLFVLFWPLVDRLARRLYPALDSTALAVWAAALTLFNFTLFRIFTYGLETGLYLVAAAICVLVSLRALERPTLAAAVGLGVAAGVATLTRIDFAVVFALFLAAAVLRRRLSIPLAAAAAGAGALVTSPWLLYVHGVAGRWLPSSGESQMALLSSASAGERLGEALLAVVHHLAPWIYPPVIRAVVPGSNILFDVALAIPAIACACWIFRVLPGAGDRPALEIAAMWTIAVVLLSTFYVAWFWSTYFYTRYFALLSLLIIPHLAAGLAIRARRAERASLGLAVLACLFAVSAASSLHSGRGGNVMAVTAHFIDAAVPRNVRVGEFSTGVSGYFLDNVINLDGKVNAGAMRARRDGDLAGYIDRSRVQLLIDWPGSLYLYLPPDYLASEWRPCSLPTPADVGSCLERRARAARTR